MKNPLIGRLSNAHCIEFLKPNRKVYFYFGSGENTKFGAGICIIPPSGTNLKHAHDDADEIIYVIKGEMRIVVEDDEYILNQGDAIILFKDLIHQIFNNSDSEDLIHTFTFSPPHPADVIRDGYGEPENIKIIKV